MTTTTEIRAAHTDPITLGRVLAESGFFEDSRGDIIA